MKIALIGLPGSGKSTIGRQLAARLDLEFFDSDAIIESQLNCSVRKFFEREGEAAFRKIEHTVIDDLTQKMSGVVSTGGGAVLTLANRCMLGERCQTIYLHSSPDAIFKRLRHDRTRPLLQVENPLARLNELYAERDPFYRETAFFTVDTGHFSAPAVVNMIAARLTPGFGHVGPDGNPTAAD